MCNFPRVIPVDEADAILKANVERFLCDLRIELVDKFNKIVISGNDVIVIVPALYFVYRHARGITSKMDTIAEEFKAYLEASGYTVQKCEWNYSNEHFTIWLNRKVSV